MTTGIRVNVPQNGIITLDTPVAYAFGVIGHGAEPALIRAAAMARGISDDEYLEQFAAHSADAFLRNTPNPGYSLSANGAISGQPR